MEPVIEAIAKHARAAAERRSLAADDLRLAAGEWLTATAPTVAELDALAEKFKLERGNLDDIMDLNEAPRLDHDARHGYLYVRCPHQHGDGSTTTRPLLIIYGGEELLTIMPVPLAVLNPLFDENSDLSTRSPQTVLLKLLAQVFSGYDAYIKGQSQAIKTSVTKMRQRKLESEDFVQFVLIEDQINSFLSALTPMVPLLRRLAVSRHLSLTDGERDALEDIALSVEQSINICNANSKRIVSVREAYGILSNNSLNRTMKALTVIMLFMAVPNVVFSMYGMNVKLPIQDELAAYPIIIGATLILLIATLIILKKKRLL